MQVETIQIEKAPKQNIIIGVSHFIKTVEDIHEVLVTAVPGIKFGLAFNEASGPCLVRKSGTNEELVDLAVDNAEKIGAGHIFVIILEDTFPINVLNAIKNVPEVCRILAATANPLQVLVVESDQGRGVIGVIDGSSIKGVEKEEDEKERKEFLRKIGYKV